MFEPSTAVGFSRVVTALHLLKTQLFWIIPGLLKTMSSCTQFIPQVLNKGSWLTEPENGFMKTQILCVLEVIGHLQTSDENMRPRDYISLKRLSIL